MLPVFLSALVLTFFNKNSFYYCGFIYAERMNHEVLYLVGIFTVGCIAIMFRAIMFNWAGERFVARLRSQVVSVYV